MNTQKNKINYSLIISFILIVSILFCYFIFFVNNHNYDEQGVNIKNFKSISTILLDNDKNIIEQKFISLNNNLDKIYFYINNLESNNTLELSLVNNYSNNVIYTHRIKIPKLECIQLVNWDFKNINNSINTSYSLFISPKIDDGFELITVPKDRYENGILLINMSENTNSILAFSFDYYSSNLFNVLYNRLPIYKVGIFEYPVSFIILFALILIMIFYITYIIIENIIKK